MYNTFIKIDANTVYFEEFSLVGINKVKGLFEKDGKLIEFDKLRQENPFYLSALLDYMPITSDNGTTAKLVNHILLIFKRSLYEMRSRKVAPSIFCIINKIEQIRDIEYQIAKKSDKLTHHINKWDLLNRQAVNS